MYFTTNGRWSYAGVWCFWFVVLLTMTWHGGPPWATFASPAAPPLGAAVALLVVPPPVSGFPGRPRPLAQVGRGPLPCRAAGLPPSGLGGTRRPAAAPGRLDHGHHRGLVDAGPTAPPVGGPAGAVSAAGNPGRAPHHQPPLPQRRPGRSRCGGRSFGAQPADGAPAAVQGGGLAGPDRLGDGAWASRPPSSTTIVWAAPWMPSPRTSAISGWIS